MSSITIQQLPQAPLPLLGSDALIISRGTNQEYKATMLSVWTINTSVFPVAASILATDQMMIWRDSNPYIVNFSDVGFIAGTAMWFYSASAPAGWQVIAIPGDAMLGIVNSAGSAAGNSFLSGGSVLSNPSTGVGSWNMLATQLPPHDHYVPNVKSETGANINGGFEFFGSRKGRNDTNSKTSGITAGTTAYGSWRPVTAIGVVAQKL